MYFFIFKTEKLRYIFWGLVSHMHDENNNNFDIK